MASAEDESKKQADPQAPSSRRHFLWVAITLGVVLVTAGIASVAKSLFEPSTAQPGPPPSGTKTVPKTVTSTVASIASLAYALTVRSPGYTMGWKSFVKAALIPTLIVGPIFIGLMTSFDMTQIFSMVIAMSTDILLSFQLVRAITVGWWFVMLAVFVLWFKARGSHHAFLFQQGIGLVFILSTTFLFNYPIYLLLGTAGVLLLSFPLRKTEPEA